MWLWIVIAFIICYIATQVFIKVKLGFWSIQPVFHIYNLSYMLNPPGIINERLPEKNKYTNFSNITTYTNYKVSEYQLQKLSNLIRINYLQNKDNIFNPKQENIIPYFQGHNQKCFLSFYEKLVHLKMTKSQTITMDNKVLGVITSRPLNISIKKENAKLMCYYVDYLCVDKLHRKQGIAPQLIQTHHYNQRHLNKNILVSLFKREDELTGIVPVCVYNNFGFRVDTWTQPDDLSAVYKILSINKQNYIYFNEYLQNAKTKFELVIEPEFSNLIELINTKNIFINVILTENRIVAAYFFRKSCIQIEKGLEVLSCYASIRNCDVPIFIQGFKISFWKLAHDNDFGFCSIEDITDNGIIIENIRLKTPPCICSPNAYFFYNFAYPTFQSKDCFILT
jgi:hypothetical protein